RVSRHKARGVTWRTRRASRKGRREVHKERGRTELSKLLYSSKLPCQIISKLAAYYAVLKLRQVL
ncbi:hypothetical protein, partial [Fischerella thermalis]|uniref:hypothetical protein n=1 Tax=Fischerella thermalis TaxID=372787 RepID=UPI001CA4DB1B